VPTPLSQCTYWGQGRQNDFRFRSTLCMNGPRCTVTAAAQRALRPPGIPPTMHVSTAAWYDCFPRLVALTCEVLRSSPPAAPERCSGAAGGGAKAPRCAPTKSTPTALEQRERERVDTPACSGRESAALRPETLESLIDAFSYPAVQHRGQHSPRQNPTSARVRRTLHLGYLYMC
jgi:hypothetical protein